MELVKRGDVEAHCLEALGAGKRRIRVVGMSTRGLLLSRMDKRSRRILNDLGILYPVDFGALLGLRRRGWRGRRPLGRLGPLEGVLQRGPSHLGRPLRVFHFGGRPGDGKREITALCARFPGIESAGVRSVLDELWGPENNQALFSISKAKPDILVVALPSPLLEEWVHAHSTIVDAGIVWGVPR